MRTVAACRVDVVLGEQRAIPVVGTAREDSFTWDEIETHGVDPEAGQADKRKLKVRKRSFAKSRVHMGPFLGERERREIDTYIA
jgi:hypothetical protein